MLEVSWRVEREGTGRRLTLDWVESGGPKVRAPGRPGFGTQLIERSAPYELDGEAHLTYAPDGVRCRLSIPLVDPAETGSS